MAKRGNPFFYRRVRKAREEDIAKGMQIIHENVTEFIDWFRARDIGPLIGQMKEKFDQISQNELERFFVGVRHDASCREMMEAMMKRVVNKLLHCVIKNVDAVAKEQGPAEEGGIITRSSFLMLRKSDFDCKSFL